MSIRKNSRKNPKPPTLDQINRRIGEMLDRHASIASEFVTSITIVATKLESDGSSTSFAVGRGDRHARINAIERHLDIIS